MQIPQVRLSKQLPIKWFQLNGGKIIIQIMVPLIFPHTTTLIQNVACHLLDSGTDIVEIWIDI